MVMRGRVHRVNNRVERGGAEGGVSSSVTPVKRGKSMTAIRIHSIGVSSAVLQASDTPWAIENNNTLATSAVRNRTWLK